MQRRTDSDHEWRWLLRARDFKQLESSSAGLLRAFASAARSTDPVAAAAALATAALAAAALAAAALAVPAASEPAAAVAVPTAAQPVAAAAEPVAAAAVPAAAAAVAAVAVPPWRRVHKRLYIARRWHHKGRLG